MFKNDSNFDKKVLQTWANEEIASIKKDKASLEIAQGKNQIQNLKDSISESMHNVAILRIKNISQLIYFFDFFFLQNFLWFGHVRIWLETFISSYIIT